MVIDDLQEVLMADYLRIPHMVLKMQQVLKNPSAYLCLQFVWYKTGGWNKGRDTLSYSQFKNDPVHGSGASIKTIERGVKLLIKEKIINATPSFNNMSEYSLNFDTIRALACGEKAPSKSLSLDEQAPSICLGLDEQAPSICLGLDEASPVNLSASPVNLSASPVNLSDKPRQIDVHNRYYTKDTNTINTNTTDNADLSASATEVEEVEKPAPAKTKTPAKKTSTKKIMTEFSSDFKATEKQIEKCNEYGINVAELIEEMADNKRANSVKHACWTSAFNTWIRNHIRFNRLKPVSSATSHQTAKTNYRKTADPLAVNDAWGYDAPMTDAERREYLNLPALDSNDDYRQPAFDFASQGVTQL